MTRGAGVLLSAGVVGLLTLSMTPVYADDSDPFPTTDPSTLDWTRDGLVTTVPTPMSQRLQEFTTSTHGSGGDFEDDDDDWEGADSGDTGRRGRSGAGLDYEEDDDDDEFKRGCGCQSTVEDPAFGALALLALGLTVVGRRRQSTMGA